MLVLFQKVCLAEILKKGPAKILTSPNKFVILGDKT